MKRQEAEDELDELYIAYYVRDEVNTEAEKQLALAKRIYEAKMKRIDASQNGKRRGSPFRELERIYKAQVEFACAKFARSEAEAVANNAEANFLAQQCRVLRLESAKLRRLLRKHGVHA